MARDPKELERIARELASLSAQERAKIIDQATRQARFKPPPRSWKPPLLTGSSHWDGGSLGREELYGDDGR